MMSASIQKPNKTFWQKVNSFIIRVGYLRAAGEMQRLGYAEIARGLVQKAKEQD